MFYMSIQKKLCLVIFTFISFCSCNHRIEPYDDILYLNLKYDSCAYFLLKTSKLKLVLRKNGEYHFDPHFSELELYEGKWSGETRGIDGDVVFFTFDCKNGERIENGDFVFPVRIQNIECSLNFRR